MVPEPRSPYAITKLDDEFYGRMFTEDCGLPVVCLRYFNVFGPRQNPRSQYAAAVPIFIDKCLRGEDIMIYGDGEQTRDFVFVKDIVAANAAAAEGNASGVFNIACGKSMSIKELAVTLKKITGSSSRILHAEERAGDVKHSLADTARARTILGFKPAFTLEDGFKATIDWLRANRS
jgi:UDP-glucose 4-epimerase